jgi:deoxyribose-phosphate aldolase
MKLLGAERFSAKAKIGALVPEDLAGSIDHTLLKAEATREELDELCTEAAKHHFASVCVNPINVRYCKAHLQGTGTMVITVVGFPLGATTTAAKVCETRKAVEDGADEIDMVINIGLLKSGCYNDVEEDIRRTVKAAHPRPVKVIIETSKLNHEEKVIACALSKAAGAHWVKTSTGFGGGGATAEDVALMKSIVGDDLEVKASGGIRSYEDAVNMVSAGATRLGASASVSIVTGKKSKGSGY